MKRLILFTMLVALVLCAVPPLICAAKVGEAAPDFTATASNGKTFRLSDYRGTYVVLEWHNNGVPTSVSTTTAAICSDCKNSGQAEARFGSRFCLPRRASRDT